MAQPGPQMRIVIALVGRQPGRATPVPSSPGAHHGDGLYQPDEGRGYMGVAGVALRASGAVAFPLAHDLQRIDRLDGVAGRDQRLHRRPAIGLDPNNAWSASASSAR